MAGVHKQNIEVGEAARRAQEYKKQAAEYNKAATKYNDLMEDWENAGEPKSKWKDRNGKKHEGEPPKPNIQRPKKPSSEGLVAPRTFSLRADDGRVMYSNVFTRKCSERRTFMRGGTALDLYVQPGALRGHHWRTMLKTMYADKLPSKFDLYQAHGKVDMAALVNGNMTINKV